MLEILRLLLAGYLIALAAGLVLGFGRPLLRWPWRSAYLLLRILLLAISLGRVKITPLAARTQIDFREFPNLVRDWNESRKGESILAQGEDLEVGELSWVTTHPESEPSNGNGSDIPAYPFFSAPEDP